MRRGWRAWGLLRCRLRKPLRPQGRGAVAGDQPGDDGLSGEKVRYSAEVGGIRQYWPCVTLRMRADALGRTAFTAYGWCSTLPIEPIPAVAALRSLAGLLRGLGLASPLR